MKASRWPKLRPKALVFALLLGPASAVAESFTITNPLILQRADPDIYLHTDGYYYFTATVPAYDLIELRRATSIQGLTTASPAVVWRAHSSGAMANHIWAPEIHYIRGSWYIYFAAGSSSDVWDIRVYVLSNSADNPLDPSWNELGQLMTNGPKSSGAFFALDATTFEHQGTQYLVWAESDPDFNVNTVLYIAPMSNPWTLSARGVRISVPEYDWETRGYAVNEGPAVLMKNGRIFISYSASATDANYCMGLLYADDTSDLLDPSSWHKSSEPVLQSSNGVYGPGHNQFTTSPDGSVDLLVYHARDYEQITGDPLDDPNRATRVQPLTWRDDGMPDFGEPATDGPLTIEIPDRPAVGGAAGAGGTESGGNAGTSAGGSSGGTLSESGGSVATGGTPVPGSGGASGASDAGAATTTGGSTLGGAQSAGGSATTGGAEPAGGSIFGGAGAIRAAGGALVGGATTLGGAAGNSNQPSTEDPNSGCGCRVGKRPPDPLPAAAWLLGLASMFWLRRRHLARL